MLAPALAAEPVCDLLARAAHVVVQMDDPTVKVKRHIVDGPFSRPLCALRLYPAPNAAAAIAQVSVTSHLSLKV